MDKPKNKLIFLLLTVLAVLSIITNLSGVGDWVYLQWLYNYSDGFQKRGLVGSTIQFLTNSYPSYSLIFGTSLVLITMTTLLIIYLISRAFYNSKLYSTILIGIVLIGGASTIPFLAYGIGRFDVFGLFLTIIGLYVIQNLNTLKTSLIIGLIGIIGVLIHQAFFFINFPLLIAAIFSLHLTNQNHYIITKKVIFFFLIVFLPVTTVLTYIQFGNPIPIETKEVLSSVYSKETGFKQEFVFKVMSLHHGSLKENISYTFIQISNTYNLFSRLISFLASLPAYAIGVIFLVTIKVKKIPAHLKLLFISALSPFLLLPLGDDWARWFALSSINFLIIILWLCQVKEPKIQSNLNFKKLKTKEYQIALNFILIVFLTFISLLIPPFSSTGKSFNNKTFSIFWSLIN